ncbi:hypothetical protein ACWPKS_06620 [Coraliomargarita sp. W4R72]
MFDDETLKANQITFTGGRIYLEDLDLNFSGAARVQLFVDIPINVSAQSRNISQTFSTPTPPGTVTESGIINLSQHQYILDQGTITYEATASFLGTMTDTINYTTAPDMDSPTGTATIIINELTSTDLERTLQFTLSTSSSEVQSELIENTQTNLTINASQQTESKATVTIPTPYAQWTADNHINLNSGDETNASRLPYRLIYALALSPDTSTWPITMTPTTVGSPIVELTLPTGGLNLALDAEYSEDLQAESWEALPSHHYQNGITSLDKGKTGNPTFTLPDSSKGFIRFKIK